MSELGNKRKPAEERNFSVRTKSSRQELVVVSINYYYVDFKITLARKRKKF